MLTGQQDMVMWRVGRLVVDRKTVLQVDRTEVVKSQSRECTDMWWIRGLADRSTGQRIRLCGG